MISGASLAAREATGSGARHAGGRGRPLGLSAGLVHIGTRYTYTVEARSGHFEPDSARGARNSTGLTEGIARARRGLGCLRRGRGMLGERSSEVGVSNAIEQLPACGRDERPGEG